MAGFFEHGDQISESVKARKFVMSWVSNEDLRFSRRWRFKSRSSGLWHCVVLL